VGGEHGIPVDSLAMRTLASPQFLYARALMRARAAAAVVAGVCDAVPDLVTNLS
jgi:hypothetical protein